MLFFQESAVDEAVPANGIIASLMTKMTSCVEKIWHSTVLVPIYVIHFSLLEKTSKWILNGVNVSVCLFFLFHALLQPAHASFAVTSLMLIICSKNCL
jgi:hypothetical protein